MACGNVFIYPAGGVTVIDVRDAPLHTWRLLNTGGLASAIYFAQWISAIRPCSN